MEVAIVTIALIAFIGFRLWLAHARRVMAHRERLAALEKGVPVPPFDDKVDSDRWPVQRLLLLAGLTWVAVGAGGMVCLSAIIRLNHPSPIPEGVQWFGFVLIGIGLAHLIVFLVDRRSAR
jgi:hypothetical protein